METRICTKCGKEKEIDKFYTRRGKIRKDGTCKEYVSSICKKCKDNYDYLRKTNTTEKLAIYKERSNVRRKKSYELNKEKQDIHAKEWFESIKGTDKYKNMWLYNKYKIRLKDYRFLWDSQNGCCAICGVSEAEYGKALNVDHDHETGMIRGLLCHVCNLGIGYANPHWLPMEKVATYLSNNASSIIFTN